MNDRLRSPTPRLSKTRPADEAEDALPSLQIRVVDWHSVGEAAAWVALPAAFLFYIAWQFPLPSRAVATAVVGLIVYLVYIWYIRKKLEGFVFDTAFDQLSLLQFGLRQSVPLSSIYDANCSMENANTGPRMLVGALLGGETSGKQHVIYLAGEFGSKKLHFHSRQWRDEFLSALHRTAPHVRITRRF